MKSDWGLRITFVNVGNGDAILIEAKDSIYEDGTFVMLVDGGSAELEEYSNSKTGRLTVCEYMKKSGINHIDIVINTHIHEDHTCGLLEVIERYRPHRFYTPFPDRLYEIMYDDVYKGQDKTQSSRKFVAALIAYKKIIHRIKEYGGNVVQLTCTTNIGLSDGLSMEVLGPSYDTLSKQMELFEVLYQNRDIEECIYKLDVDMNNISLCLAINYGDKVILLSGDTPRDGYHKIVKADVFKLGHHGQKNSIDDNLLKSIEPEIAIICASSDRRYDSANPMVLELLREYGIKTYYTDCPDVPPYTNELSCHNGVCVEFYKDTGMKVMYV